MNDRNIISGVNPPAFPTREGQSDPASNKYIIASTGMSLRDYFAACALPQCIDLASTLRQNVVNELPWTNPAAKAAYEMADAMLKERAK